MREVLASSPRRVGWRITDKHRVETSHIPYTGQRVQRQVRRHSVAPLERTAFDTTSSNVPVQVVGTSLHREVCEADLERVACGHRWRAVVARSERVRRDVEFIVTSVVTLGPLELLVVAHERS